MLRICEVIRQTEAKNSVTKISKQYLSKETMQYFK